MENSIIIRNLPKGIFVPELCEIFRCFGNIVSATIQYDEQKQSIGEAYVEFDDKYSALQAVSSRNNSKLKNNSLHVYLSIENSHFKQVFVKNFSPSWEEIDLMKAFEHIGSIETIKISEDKGKSNGYGFIVFNNHTTAKRAIQSMNGKTVNGLKLIVDRFKSKLERVDLIQNSLEQVGKRLQQSIQLNNLYIKNLPSDLSEDQLRKLFKKYGEIISVKIAIDGNGASKQFGFVSFKNKEDAATALERMNGHPLKGKKLHINFKEDGELRKQYNVLKNKDKEVKIRQYKQQAKSLPKFLPHSMNYREQSGSS